MYILNILGVNFVGFYLFNERTRKCIFKEKTEIRYFQNPGDTYPLQLTPLVSVSLNIEQIVFLLSYHCYLIYF